MPHGKDVHRGSNSAVHLRQRAILKPAKTDTYCQFHDVPLGMRCCVFVDLEFLVENARTSGDAIPASRALTPRFLEREGK